MIGSTVGPYQILDRLGVGGMGEVFLGHDPRLQRRVALKCLTVPDTPGTDGHGRVLREARAAARLSHPHIAAVYDVLDHDGRTFIVMEYVEGESLAARLRRERLPVDEVRAIGRQLASALAAAHMQGVIHRDLKPANIHLTSGGSIKVLDFGVAKLSPPSAPTGAATAEVASESTIAGNPGTPIYMSPEQLFGREIDLRSDIYSLGVILFEMATGRRPYQETGAMALASAITAGTPPPPRSLNSDVPADLDAVIMRALEREPDKRFQSARELEAAMVPESSLLRVTVTRPRNLWRGAVVGLGAVALVLAVAIPLRRSWLATSTSTVPTPTRRAVAVLPLENLSGDRAKEYLGAGVAETLTMALSKVPSLIVLSRSEVMAAVRRDRDIKRLTHDLDVSYCVDGSVQEAGSRFRITLRLIRPDGTVAWSEGYEDDEAALFALHRAMASDIVAQLEGHSADGVDLTVPSTTNVDALTAYWRGRSILDRAVTDADFQNALSSFRRAVALDPKFALGYAGISDTLWQQYQVTHDSSLPDQALDAGLTALKLDAAQPAVRVAVATVYQGMGQSDAAVDQLHRALDLQPSNDDAHRVLARVLSSEGKSEEAIAELQRAIAYRPKQWANYNDLGRVYYQLRRLPEAAATYQKALDILPNDARTLLSLGAVYLEAGDLPRALEMFERSNKVTPTGLALSNMGTVYYRLGRLNEAVTAFEAAVRIESRSPLLHGNLGDAYLRLHRTADAKRQFTTARALALDALRVNDKDARTLGRIAGFEAKLGLAREATAHAAEAVALAPRDADIRYKQAIAAALTGSRADALRFLKQALDLGFNAAVAWHDDDLAALKGLAEFEALTGHGR